MARQQPRSPREYRPSQERTSREHTSPEYTNEKPRRRSRQHSSTGRRDSRAQSLPQYNHNGDQVTKGIHPDGESGRRGFHPFKFLKIAFKSSSTPSLMVNCLWPVVPVAIALVQTLLQDYRKTSTNRQSALRKARMAPRYLHHELHCHGPCSQHARLCWPRTIAQDASEGHCRCPRDYPRLRR
jgi:hypothetical protein